MNNDGLPDHTLFPADPLYILANLSIGVQAWPNQMPPTGLSGSGSVANGAGWTRTFNGIPGAAPPTGEAAPKRIAQTSYSGDIATLTVSPSASVTISGTPMGAPGSTSIFIGQVKKPILLGGVDIFGRPDFGDGLNQYAYDNTIEGQVQIPANAPVPGSGYEDLDFLRPSINWAISPIIAGQTQYSVLFSTETIHPLSRYYPDDLSFAEVDKLVFKGIPQYNSQFGTRSLTLTISGNPSLRASIQLFYEPFASNYPGSSGIPNFYYYYNQVFPSPGQYRFDGNSTTEPTPPYRIWIGYGAAHPYAYRVFTHSGGPAIDSPGWHYIAGLHSYIFHCGHELGHQVYLSLGIDIPGRPAGQPNDPNGDRDGDGLSNQWEFDHFLNPDHPRTVLGTDDYQLIADVYGWSVLQVYKSYWTYDWSQIGLQWGNWGQRNAEYSHYFGLASPQTHYHPWYFLRDSGFPEALDPPLTALTAMPVR